MNTRKKTSELIYSLKIYKYLIVLRGLFSGFTYPNYEMGFSFNYPYFTNLHQMLEIKTRKKQFFLFSPSNAEDKKKKIEHF